jgi:hypothetical protein
MLNQPLNFIKYLEIDEIQFETMDSYRIAISINMILITENHKLL